MIEAPPTVVVQPGLGMLQLFRTMGYTPWYAIGEFVDNALQSWRENREQLDAASGGRFDLLIDVELDRSLGIITVTDNAAGISTLDIPRAFTPAAPPVDSSGLSQFGVGMKSAACWYGDRFDVTTTALGEAVRRRIVFDLAEITKTSTGHIAVDEEPADADEHGTTVVLRHLNHPVPTGATLSRVREYLASIYRVFLRDDRVHLTVQGQVLRAPEVDLLVAPRWDDSDGVDRHWRKDLSITLPSGRTITGWAGNLAKGSTRKAGFALLYRDKVVHGAGGMAGEPTDSYRPAEIFGAGNTFESQRLVGELDVSSIPVTHTKDALVWDAAEESDFVRALAEELDSEPLPLRRMANGYRVVERGRSVQSSVEAALDEVVRHVDVPLVPRRAPWMEHEEPRPPMASSYAGAPSVPIERVVLLHEEGEAMTIRVIDDLDDGDWLRVEQRYRGWSVTVNRAHRFMQTFANLQGADIQPILRLAVAFARAQISAERSGSTEPRFQLAELNRLLSGSLADRVIT